MKCHYEVLGVARTASDTDLKKAYKKLALRWHPDKNLDNPDEAKEQFQLVQQAWEVLSDPRERAWYDDHREAILRGAADKEYEDDAIDLFQYFSSTCFKGYGDDEKGFYTVYRTVFETLAAEDAEFALDGDLDEEVPSFGDSQSSYEEVVHSFYAYWQSYRTKRSYSWLDPYEFRSASNRRVLRIIEKENKKIRDKAKRERNEQVRNLVAFVYKRDKRVQAHAAKLAERAKNNLKKTEERRKQQLLDRQRQLKEHKESEWSKFSNMEAELKNIEANLAQEFGEKSSSDVDTESEDKPDNALYCVACNKLFKTQKAFANHENSKKHKDNVTIMKTSMMEEEENLKDASDDEDSDSEASGMDNRNVARDSQIPDFLLNPEHNPPVNNEDSGEDSEDELMSDDEGSEDQTSSRKEKEPLPEGVKLATGPEMDDALYVPPATEDNECVTSEDELISDKEDETSEEDRILRRKKKLKRGSNSRVGRESLASSISNTKQSSSQSLTDEKLPGNRLKKPRRRKGNTHTKYEKNTETSDKGEDDLDEPTQELETDKKLEADASDNQAIVDKRKEKQKKRKEAKAQKQAERGNKSKTKTVTDVSDLVNRCFTCNKEFISRNKLFEHLKRAGHGLLINETNKVRSQDSKDKAQKKHKGVST